MNANRTMATGFLAAAAIAALAACSSNSAGHNDGASLPQAQAVTVPHPSAAAPQNANDPNQPVGAVATADPTTPPQAPQQRRAPAGPEFANTTVFGLVKSAHTDDGVVRLVWDKADWTFYPASKGMVDHLKSCQQNVHGAVMTNCSTALRTTVVPASAQILSVNPWCGPDDPRWQPDPLHPGRRIGKVLISHTEFVNRVHNGCGAIIPAPGMNGLWLTFDGSGNLVKIAETFDS